MAKETEIRTLMGSIRTVSPTDGVKNDPILGQPPSRNEKELPI